ncbi:hypothetical protein [Dyadobacter psychrotolerans]|nr:hypothetical protein [Dyadobacter psychrotolerans]
MILKYILFIGSILLLSLADCVLSDFDLHPNWGITACAAVISGIFTSNKE